MPMRRGSAGSGRLRAASNSPSAASRFFSCSKASCSAPRPLRLHVLADELILALGVVDAEPAARDDVQAVLGLELQLAQRRAEHHALDLRAGVLQREVEVAGAPHACSSRARPRPSTSAKPRLDEIAQMPAVSSLTVRRRRAARPAGVGGGGPRTAGRRAMPSRRRRPLRPSRRRATRRPASRSASDRLRRLDAPWRARWPRRRRRPRRAGAGRRWRSRTAPAGRVQEPLDDRAPSRRRSRRRAGRSCRRR